ncbi:MAG: histidine phosphatase family protein [Bacillota bacterium]|nr:histidine phosphatase family protein [Bacillota bacterium]
MKLVIIRHGETIWNNEMRTQGITDIPLSEKGRRQALSACEAVNQYGVSCAYSSPLKRALDTAAIILQGTGIEAEARPELMELAFGIWEGMTFYDIKEHYPDKVELWRDFPHRFSVRGSERLHAAQRRIRAFIEYAGRCHENDTVLVVTHSITARIIIADAIGLPIRNLHKLRMDNAAISVIDYQKARNVLQTFNETAHLKGLKE